MQAKLHASSASSDLRALATALSAVVARFDQVNEDGEGQKLSRRLEELITAINTTPPRSLGEVLVKLRLLADPDIGMAAGDREDDLTSLRQVVAFLEALRG